MALEDAPVWCLSLLLALEGAETAILGHPEP